MVINSGFDVTLHGMRLTTKSHPTVPPAPTSTDKKERGSRLASLGVSPNVRLAGVAVASIGIVVLTAAYPPCSYARAWASVVIVLLATSLNRLHVLQLHADALLVVALLTLASSTSTVGKDAALIIVLVACSAHAIARRWCEHPPHQTSHVVITAALAVVLLMQTVMAIALWLDLGENFRAAMMAAFLALYAVCLCMVIAPTLS